MLKKFYKVLILLKICFENVKNRPINEYFNKKILFYKNLIYKYVTFGKGIFRLKMLSVLQNLHYLCKIFNNFLKNLKLCLKKLQKK